MSFLQRTGALAAGGLLASALLLGGAGEAAACGGFFCGQTPVDQNAERIVFRVNNNNTVTAYVQIAYSGNPEDFSWVVPIPSVADLEVFPDRAITALDLATQPVFTPPWQCLAVPEANAGAGGRDDLDDDGDGVTVHERENVGPFETVTVSSEDPEALVTWLRDNGYRITTAMEPFVKLYVDDGMLFLAMKLQPGQETAAVQPIVMTYDGTVPSIPLRLTAVASEPEMGVIAWVLADQRFGPANFRDITISDDDIQFDPWTFRTNYLDVVSAAVDAAGGQAFVTEYAQSTGPLAEQLRNSFVRPGDDDGQAAMDAVIGLVESSTYITRLYTRLNPEEMGVDPEFGPHAGGDVSNVHDLSDRDDCETIEDPPPCDFNYCGRGARCEPPAEAVNSRQAACACVAGQVARVTQDASGGMNVTCQDSRMRFPNESGAPAFDDPCSGVSCGGNGSCVNMNGTPTCACNIGFVARGEITDSGRLLPACVEPATPIPPDFYEIPLPELPTLNAFIDLHHNVVVPPGVETPPEQPRPPTRNNSGGSSGCAQTGGELSAAWLLLGLGLLRRRRAAAR